MIKLFQLYKLGDTMAELNLLDIRNEIDIVDAKIIDLYEKRMNLCKDVAEYKIENGKPVLDTSRENLKIEKVKSLVSNDFDSRGVEELFKHLMSMSRKLQYTIMADHGLIEDTVFEMLDEIPKGNVKVAYQGLEGAYAHDATCQYFNESANMYHVDTWRDAMEDVKCGRCDFAVLPIENSTAGAISQVYDLLIEYDNYIVGETFVKVEHALLGTKEATINDINVVYSHPQSLMQCSKYLFENKQWKQISLSNNAVSAKKVMDDGDKTQAAIASVRAAKIYGLKVLKEHINFNDTNTTRFVIVGSKRVYTKNAGKISVCFEIPHEEGSLYNILSHFMYNQLNMTKIESRPIEGRKWEYRFFIDFEGKLGDPAVKNALRGLREETIALKILGNY
jgi:chorismate mutase / prephenate dehydratase